jgi:hypothetical protein
LLSNCNLRAKIPRVRILFESGTKTHSTLFKEHKSEKAYANIKPARTKRKKEGLGEEQSPGFAGMSAEAWSLHQSLYNNTQEAEFSFAKGGQGSSDQWDGSDVLHSGDWA